MTDLIGIVDDAELQINVQLIEGGAKGEKGDKGDKGDTGAQGPIGNVMFATFDIDTGELMMTTPDGYTGPTFLINDETGELEVSI